MSVEEAEGQAALIGLQSLANLYRGSIVLELDCRAIANELQSYAHNRSPCYALIEDIKPVDEGTTSNASMI